MMEGSRSSSSKSCFTCQTRGRTEWCALTEEELKLLDKAKVSRDYLPGEVIFREADACQGIHCIESGLVGVRKMNANGQEILLRLGYPGDTLGYRSMLSGDDHNNSAEALEPSEVCFIDATTVRTLLTRNPTLGLRFLNHAATDFANLVSWIWLHAGGLVPDIPAQPETILIWKGEPQPREAPFTRLRLR